MNLNKHGADTEMEMDMTSMIDVVFLLIIFFMVITDLSQQDLEELKLPIAQTAVQDKPDPTLVRPVVNIQDDGRIIVKRKELYDPEVDDMREIEGYLADQARAMPRKPIDEKNPASMKVPDNPLLIRADENTPFKFIQKVMEVCGKKGIEIWKVEIAAAEDPEKVKERKAAEE